MKKYEIQVREKGGRQGWMNVWREGGIDDGRLVRFDTKKEAEDKLDDFCHEIAANTSADDPETEVRVAAVRVRDARGPVASRKYVVATLEIATQNWRASEVKREVNSFLKDYGLVSKWRERPATPGEVTKILSNDERLR